jgi:hypothetical protein
MMVLSMMNVRMVRFVSRAKGNQYEELKEDKEEVG